MKRFRSLDSRNTDAVSAWCGVVVLLLAMVACVSSAVMAAESVRKPAAAYERIVSLGPLITENIFLLGAGDSLVGNTIYCQRPEAARAKEKVGSVQELSIERIVALQPQLILANNLTPPQQVEKLRHLGFQVEIFRQPASFADICAHFLRLGRLLGREEQAEAIVAQARHKVEAVRQAVAPWPRRKVFLQVGAHPLFSSVKSSFTNDFIELGGGINVAGEQRSGAMKIEQVLALNPDLIIIAVMGSEHGVGAGERQRWQDYTAIEAVRAGRVHVMDPDLVCSPSPATFADTLVTIARLIHPEAVIANAEDQHRK
jgi:iron complex transport system substrate-binding protein